MSQIDDKLIVRQSFRAKPLRPDILSISVGIVSALFAFLLWLKNPETISPWSILIWLEGGLFVGFVVGWIYTFILQKKLHKTGRKTFEIDLNNPLNIIQKDEGVNPYTIVFVANPWLLKHQFDDAGNIRSSNLEKDPIIEDKNGELFYRIVVRSIKGFLENELLSLPEIFPKIRFITIFGAHGNSRGDLISDINENALCENIPGDAGVLLPREPSLNGGQYNNIVKDYVDKAFSGETTNEEKNPCDVIFTVSGVSDQPWAAAFFTHEKENGNGTDNDKSYKFSFGSDADATDRKHVAEPEEKGAGLASISAWDDRPKTVVHEFAHAMSSEKNGAIVDEYVDEYHQDTEEEIGDYIINRKKRARPGEPVPDTFATYGLVTNPHTPPKIYDSDRYRNDKDADWKSYVAERPDMDASCIMDYAYNKYYFDKLLHDFMYDRLLTKINRP